MKTLRDIMRTTSQYRTIKKFISHYSTFANEKSVRELEIIDSKNALPAGFYLQAFANGLDSVLDRYHQVVVELEKKFLKKH